jgi:hypothetical protein
MFSIRRIFTTGLAFALSLCLVACGSEQVSENTESARNPAAKVDLENIEYKTIEPPTDGWTQEMFEEVFYLNGKQVHFPLTMRLLGSDYEYDDLFDGNSPGNYTEGNLFYGDQKIAIVGYDGYTLTTLTDDTEFSGISTVASFFKSHPEYISVFVINGVTLNTPKEEALKSLGDNYEIVGVDEDYVFNLDNSDNRFTISFDEETDTVFKISVRIVED